MIKFFNRIYYTGIRRMYFYLVYFAAFFYFNPPPFKGKYGSLEDILVISKKDLGKFAFICDEKSLGKFLKNYFKQPNLIFSISKKIEKKKKSILKKFSSQNLKKRGLPTAYKELSRLIKYLFYLNQIVWHLDMSGCFFLKGKLKKEDIGILTQPDKISYLQKEELEFLKICLKYFKDKKDTNLDNLLEKHLKKFAYIGVSYYNEPPKKQKDYLKQIKEYANKKYTWKDINSILDEKKSGFKEIIKKRDVLYNKIEKEDIKKLILILREAAHLKNYFRDSLSEIIHYYFNPLLKELSIRFKIKENQIKSLNCDEIEKLFINEKADLKEIKQRQNCYAIITKNHKLFILYGEKAEALEKRYFIQNQTNKKELKGTSAYEGKTTGSVKIILDYNDFKKFKKGNILVATNTMPEYMPILRLAKAIITEVGGVTCHAAIVSRELKIPCVIGTKIATKVLKDGDLVEVDAEKGIVRIIKKIDKNYDR